MGVTFEFKVKMEGFVLFCLFINRNQSCLVLEKLYLCTWTHSINVEHFKGKCCMIFFLKKNLDISIETKMYIFTYIEYLLNLYCDSAKNVK